MFTCQNCRTSTKLGQPINEVVTEKRPRTYTKYIREGERRWREEQVEGWEIGKVVRVCPPCYTTLTGLEPRRVAEIAKPKRAKPDRPKKVFNRIEFVDKSDPMWKRKKELAEIKRRESRSPDPRPPTEKRKPVVEFVNRVPSK